MGTDNFPYQEFYDKQKAYEEWYDNRRRVKVLRWLREQIDMLLAQARGPMS